MPDEPDLNFDPNSATIPMSGPRPKLSGSKVDLPLPEELTRLLPAGAYNVTGFLGAGGMGAVYKGTQVRLKRPVAIKIMRRDKGKDHDFEARFEREAQAMAKLNHQNIISVFDFGEAGPDYLYIGMELVDGTDLMEVIRSQQMTQETALQLLPQICDALQFAHDHGIVHRDIKPGNIMLTRDGRVKMADFGLAKLYGAAESTFRTQTGTGMGTPDYAAPEQFDTTLVIDHRADIYALGVMIYQMVTGALPRGVWRPPSQRAKVALQWDAVISRAMQNDPADRYQQAREVKTDIITIPLPRQASGADAGISFGKEEKRMPPPARFRVLLLAGVVSTVAVITIGAFFVLKRPDHRSAASGSAAAFGAGTQPLQHPPGKSDDGEPWQNVFLEPSRLRLVGGAQATPEGLSLTNLDTTTIRFGNGYLPRDGAVRARATFGEPTLKLQARASVDGHYQLYVNPNQTLVLAYWDAVTQQHSGLAEAYLIERLAPGEDYELELRVVGSLLTAKLNGTTLLIATNAALAAGAFGVGVTDRSPEVTCVKFLEVLNLDKTAEVVPGR